MMIVAPRLIQLSSSDPYINPKRFNFYSVQKATAQEPYPTLHGLPKVFSTMSCRTNTSVIYSTKDKEQNGLDLGMRLIDRTLRAALPVIISHMDVDESGITKSGHELGSIDTAMNYVFRQIDFGMKQEGTKDLGEGLGFLQRRIWEVMMGALLIFENMELYQELKRTASGSGTPQTAKTAHQQKVAMKSKGYLKQVIPRLQKQSEFKKRCINSLAAFLAFGTAGLFAVWRNYREVRIPAAYDLIHLVGRIYTNASRGEDTEFEHEVKDRAFPRIDMHIFEMLRCCPHATESPVGNNWTLCVKAWTERMAPRDLCERFVADVLDEVVAPGLSASPSGKPAPNVDKTQLADKCFLTLLPTMKALAIGGLEDSAGGGGKAASEPGGEEEGAEEETDSESEQEGGEEEEAEGGEEEEEEEEEEQGEEEEEEGDDE